MATGESSFSTRGKQAKRVSFEPVPKGDYQVKLDTTHLEVAKSDNPGSKPYVNGLRLEVLDSATEEGGKNRLVFTALFTGITPSKKGNTSFEMASGPLGLARALGTEIDVPAGAIKTYPGVDENGDPDGSTTQIVDPKFLIQWLKQHEGEIVGAHIKVKSSKQYDPRNEVAYFIEADSQAEAPAAEGFETEAASTDGDSWGSEEVQPMAEQEVEEVPARAVQLAPRNGALKQPIRAHVAAKAVQKKPAGKGARR